MRSTVALLLISFVFVQFARSQSNELLIQGQTGGLYLEHTVVAKENWYSVGRLYNISPKEVAPFNSLTMAQPLTIGQTLKIPLTVANFSQTGQKTPAETLIPVYHIVQEKEWMYRVSVNHNKVPLGNLEKWNSINKDQVKAGMHLIVGYLKVKTTLSALATGVGAAPVVAMPAVGGTTNRANAPVTGTTNVTKPAVNDAAATNGAPAMTVTKPATTNSAAASNNAANTTTTTPVPTPTPPVKAPVTTTSPAPASAASAVPAIHFNGGYFKTDYTESGKSATGPAGTFKSTSGWQDGKYYALMNNVAVGTIVKVTLTSTNKSVYVKVLGQLPDMRESAGLTIRISNAAASELGENEAHFPVDVKY